MNTELNAGIAVSVAKRRRETDKTDCLPRKFIACASLYLGSRLVSF
jgi:hypothetical protein